MDQANLLSFRFTIEEIFETIQKCHYFAAPVLSYPILQMLQREAREYDYLRVPVLSTCMNGTCLCVAHRFRDDSLFSMVGMAFELWLLGGAERCLTNLPVHPLCFNERQIHRRCPGAHNGGVLVDRRQHCNLVASFVVDGATNFVVRSAEGEVIDEYFALPGYMVLSVGRGALNPANTSCCVRAAHIPYMVYSLRQREQRSLPN